MIRSLASMTGRCALLLLLVGQLTACGKDPPDPPAESDEPIEDVLSLDELPEETKAAIESENWSEAIGQERACIVSLWALFWQMGSQSKLWRLQKR